MTADTYVPTDVPDLTQPVFEPPKSAPSEKPPKRRGRPKMTDEQKAEAAAKRAAQGPSQKPTRARTRERAPRRAPQSLEVRLGAFIAQINIFIWVIPQTRADALDPAEIKALASALDQQCRQSPRFRSYIEKMLIAGSGAQLGMVLAMIAGRRAARHGMVPQQFDDMLGAQIAEIAAMEPTPSPVIEKPNESDGATDKPAEQPTE